MNENELTEALCAALPPDASVDVRRDAWVRRWHRDSSAVTYCLNGFVDIYHEPTGYITRYSVRGRVAEEVLTEALRRFHANRHRVEKLGVPERVRVGELPGTVYKVRVLEGRILVKRENSWREPGFLIDQADRTITIPSSVPTEWRRTVLEAALDKSDPMREKPEPGDAGGDAA